MGTPASGAISIQDLADEFGGSVPHSLSEYYRNGGLVPFNNTNIPTSGTISLSNCYAASNEIAVTLSNSTVQNASTLFGTNFTSTIPKRIEIPSGVEIGGSTSAPALVVPAGMAGTLIINIAGILSGAGGNSGNNNGGNALEIASNNVTINLTGTLRAGGGGGGNGGARS